MLDTFFKRYKNIGDLDLAELSQIANTKVKVKMTAIRNLEMAKQINISIFTKIDEANLTS